MKVFSLESFPLYGRPSVCLNKGNKPCYYGDGYYNFVVYAIVNIEFVGYVIVVPYGFLMGMAIVPSEGY